MSRRRRRPRRWLLIALAFSVGAGVAYGLCWYQHRDLHHCFNLLISPDAIHGGTST